MTEAEWDSCTDPQKMLKYLRTTGRASDRKLKLFAVACCRIIWPHFKTECCRTAVEVVERYADSLAGEEELAVAAQAVGEASVWGGYAVGAAYATASNAIEVAQQAAAREFAPGQSLRSLRNARHSDLLRDLLGPLPFRVVRLDSTWLARNDGTLRHLAEATYAERDLPSGALDTARLAVLAEALEEAGCHDEEILSHLRQQGVAHYRGCWVVDLILSKE